MIVVSALRIAPVKALGTVARDTVRLTRDGVPEDRRLYLLDGAGRLVTMRRHPELTRLVPSLDLAAGTVAVRLPDGTAATSPLAPTGPVLRSSLFGKERRGRAVPGAVADAISEYAGEPLTLVLAERAGTGWDEGPVSILARDSVAAVGVPDGEDGPSRFRMLVEVTGVPAYGEEAWVGRLLRVGSAVLAVTHPLGRCVVIDHSPGDGSRDWNGLQTLARLRGRDRLDLGVIASVAEPGQVSVGDVVEPADRRPHAGSRLPAPRRRAVLGRSGQGGDQGPRPQHRAPGPRAAGHRLDQLTQCGARVGAGLPAELGADAGAVQQRHAEAQVQPGRVQRLHPGVPGGAQTEPEHRGGEVHPARAERLGDVVAGDRRLRGEVERAAGPALEHPGDRVGDVIGVHHRDHEPPVQRQEGQPSHCRRRQPARQAVPGQPGPGVELQHEPRAQAGHHRWLARGLVRVDEPLGGDLVPAVRRAGGARGGPALVHPASRPGGVGADRGHVHEVRHRSPGRGCHHLTGPAHPETLQVVELPRRLEPPGQVHHGVGAAERLVQPGPDVVRGEVRPVPGHLIVRRLGGRQTAGDADEVVVTTGGEAPQQRRPDVAAGPGDRDAHADQPRPPAPPRHVDRETLGRDATAVPPRRRPSESVDLFRSTAVALGDGARFRFVHVDGRQDHDGVVHDLLLAGRHLVPGGLVAVLARDCESPGRVVLSLWSS